MARVTDSQQIGRAEGGENEAGPGSAVALWVILQQVIGAEQRRRCGPWRDKWANQRQNGGSWQGSFFGGGAVRAEGQRRGGAAAAQAP